MYISPILSNSKNICHCEGVKRLSQSQHRQTFTNNAITTDTTYPHNDISHPERSEGSQRDSSGRPLRMTESLLLTTKCQLPNESRNYAIVDSNKVNLFVKMDKYALPLILDTLQKSNDEAEITESLYILDRMIDNGIKDVDKMYPVLSRFNDTKSPNIQTFLAGIYRKLQVPDAFGPLVKMLIQNSINPSPSMFFDPNEEIGGAILSYISDRFRN